MTLPAPALVFRRVPADRRHLAWALAPDADRAGGTWWELVDVAGAPDAWPAGVAVTCVGPDGLAHVVALAAVSTADGDPLPRLLLELVTALRCTDAVAVEVCSGRPDLLAALDHEDADRAGDRVVVRF
jgi:hypothetical protein